MKPRTTLLIIGATTALFVGGLLLVVLLGRGLQALRSSMTSEVARQGFVARWRPPSAPEPERLFPNDIGGRRVHDVGTLPPLAGVAPAGPALQASYARPGHPDIAVLAARADENSASLLFRQAREEHAALGGAKTVIEVPGRLRLSSTRPPTSTELWSLHGWFFRYQSTGELDADFIRRHLAAISAPKPD